MVPPLLPAVPVQPALSSQMPTRTASADTSLCLLHPGRLTHTVPERGARPSIFKAPRGFPMHNLTAATNDQHGREGLFWAKPPKHSSEQRTPDFRPRLSSATNGKPLPLCCLLLDNPGRLDRKTGRRQGKNCYKVKMSPQAPGQLETSTEASQQHTHYGVAQFSSLLALSTSQT